MVQQTKLHSSLVNLPPQLRLLPLDESLKSPTNTCRRTRSCSCRTCRTIRRKRVSKRYSDRTFSPLFLSFDSSFSPPKPLRFSTPSLVFLDSVFSIPLDAPSLTPPHLTCSYPNLIEVRTIPGRKNIAFVEFTDEASSGVAREALHNSKQGGEDGPKLKVTNAKK